jgi:hypothetical protein
MIKSSTTYASYYTHIQECLSGINGDTLGNICICTGIFKDTPPQIRNTTKIDT